MLTFASKASNLFFIVSYSPLDWFVSDIAVVEMAAVYKLVSVAECKIHSSWMGLDLYDLGESIDELTSGQSIEKV